MKKILGLDLGTTSIGWAFVQEAEGSIETSDIINAGVRINPLSTDEKTDFEKGNPITLNAERTLKRGARRSLDRYQLRRDGLLEILKKYQLVPPDFHYAENAKNTSFLSHQIRAKAASEEITFAELAQALLMMNKKRGYESSRKANNSEEGQAINGMAIAKKLYETNQTPGELVYQRLLNKEKYIPEFYPSDLHNELNKIWAFQENFYPDIFTKAFKEQLSGKGKKETAKTFLGKYQVFTAENKGKKEEQLLQRYKLRTLALTQQLSIEELALVISDINNDLNHTSSYLGKISDRSKALYFNQQTVGQYQYQQLLNNPHTSLKNQVFYREDYKNEFEKIWATQAAAHPELTDELKNLICDNIIFYQRKLKSQKHLISFCEFEKQHRVVARSSPLFQIFKIWQGLNNLKFTDLKTKEKQLLDAEAKAMLFEELNIKGNLTPKQALKILGYSEKEYEANFKNVEGNRTHRAFYEAYIKILETEGYEIDMERLSAQKIQKMVKNVFQNLGIDTAILDFDPYLSNNEFSQQKSYQLWHLLYSVEEVDAIKKALIRDYGFKKEHLPALLKIALKDNYGNLSAKAIKKILPFMEDGYRYDDAVKLAGYGSHSNAETKAERDKKPLQDKLRSVEKNELRNPVVEKILNQMVNLVNEIIANPALGRPDEIRIELARDLKKNAKDRKEMSTFIVANTKENEAIKKLLKEAPYYIKNPTRNDVIRYKLYKEIEPNGYRTLYSNTYIAAEKLFSKEFDIDHIIPQSLLFDDSFSNKTLETGAINREKGNRTAIDFVRDKYGAEGLAQYKARMEKLFKTTKKGKFNKLVMPKDKIPEDFLERDLRNTQYIAKKAKEILETVIKPVVSTSGEITAYLREDWGLVNIMQELNFEKYKALELTEIVEKKDGNFKERIKDWSKRDDHRHHVMDAITVAFTKHSFIQYLNNLSAKEEDTEKGKNIKGIERKELHRNERGNLVFNQPMEHFRAKAKEVLENVLVSFKAKNKVVTKNKNKIKQKGKDKIFIQDTLTPRGQLHKETIYGNKKQYVIKLIKIDSKLDAATIQMIANEAYKKALAERLAAFDNNPKLAFTGKNSLDKNPVYWDENRQKKVPDSIKLVYFHTIYTGRKPITPDLKIEKVIDKGVQKALQKRLDKFGGDPKKAFTDLDKNPIWLNEEKKAIAIKRVTLSGVSNAEPLHYKKDHFGKQILDANGKPIPVDYVQTGNNHHVAIYRDEKGNLQEEVVSFFEAVERTKQGLPVINKNHPQGWEFLFTMKQNEMFIFSKGDFNANEIDLFDPKYRKEISKRLFRIQKISSRNYLFAHHLQTKAIDGETLKNLKIFAGVTYNLISTVQNLKNLTKVRLNHLGEIVQVGEY